MCGKTAITKQRRRLKASSVNQTPFSCDGQLGTFISNPRDGI